MNANGNEQCIEQFNKLLRGELSAVETYDQALSKVEEHPEKERIQAIRDDHQENVGLIKKHIQELGGKPGDSSGVWGAFAKSVEGAATLFGNETALKALKTGEEHGMNDYENALSQEFLKPECRKLISDTLIPKTKEHISSVEKVLGQ